MVIVLNSIVFSCIKIIDLEDSIVQLKEDLVHEREEARLEKEKLKQSVVSTLEIEWTFHPLKL